MSSKVFNWIKKDGFKLFLIVAVFLAVAVYGALKFSPWHDESYSVMLIEQDVGGIISSTANDVHPPLYYIVLRAWSMLFGDSLSVLRLSSAVFMLGAVILVWHTLLKQRVITSRPYLILAFMLLGSFSVRFAFELRMYALGALLVATAFWLSMKIVKLQRPSVPLGILMGVVLAASVYTHYFLGFFALAVGIFLLWATGQKRPWRRSFLRSTASAPLKTIVISYTTLLLIFAAWLPIAYQQFSEVREGGFWIGPLKVETISSMLINSVTYMHQWMLHGWQAIGGLLVLVALIVILYRGYRMLSSTAAGKFMITAVVVPLLLLIIVSLPPLTPAFQDRYLSFYSAFLYAGIAIVISSILFHKKSGPLLKLAAVVVCIGFVVGIYNVGKHGNNQGYHPSPYFTANEIREVVLSSQNSAEQIVITNDLWYFFDMHVVFRGTGVPTYMYVPEGQAIYEYGNWSALRGREELLIRNLEELPSGTQVSFVFSSGDTEPDGSPLDSSLIISQEVFGYAKVNTYQLP